MDVIIAEKLLQQAPDALLLADRHGLILFANEAVTTLFGYANQDLVGKHIECLMPERYRGLHVSHRDHFVAQPSHRTMGHRGVPLFGRRNDGSEFPIWVSLSPIAAAGGMQIAAAIRDVSDWEQLTQHLREAREQAEQASQSKSRFLATASHDLRQPLQALQLLNTGLARKLADPAIKMLVDRQQHAIDSMTELLNALLDISKLESGTVCVVPEPVSVRNLMADIHEQVESLVSTKQLTLSMDIADLTLLTDRVLFRQLAQNLIGNAIKYTDHGSVTVRLWREPERAVLEIADSGAGIPRDQLAKIFDAYYQPHAARPDRPGVGLGLAIVKKVTEMLGLGLNVESQPGIGTRFAIHIPAEQLTASVTTPDKPAALGARPTGGGVLIIEDDHAVREAIALALELEGFTPFTAQNAVTAEQAFRAHDAQIDVVVSDYHVDAGHTGVDIVKSLRQLRERPLPAVFLTGDTSLAIRAQQQLTATRLLSKPVDIHQLIEALSGLMAANGTG